MIPFILPMIAGLMAKSYGRSFWTWFLIGVPLPLIANIILLCLPDRTQKDIKAEKKDDCSSTRMIRKMEDDELDLSAIA